MMKLLTGIVTALLGLLVVSPADVTIDEEVFGDSLGGWRKRSKEYSQYVISGTKYRSYRPEWTITPDGGIYVSVRIDHVRGWMSSDDHAVLEITVSPLGEVVSAQSNIAIQGRSISSDVIQGVGDFGSKVSSIDKAVQIGTDLVANLSAKLLRTKMVEPGRVSFPSAVRHNYNLLYRSIRVDGKPPEDIMVELTAPEKTASVEDLPQPLVPSPAAHAAALEIRNYTGIAGGADTKKNN